MDFEGRHIPTAVCACRRSGARHRLLYSKDAFLEILAADGKPWRLALLEIGHDGGLCFGLTDGQPAVALGSTLDLVVVAIFDARIVGSLTIAHATEEFASGTICGAKFRPATPEDERLLKEAIATLGG